MLVENLDKTTLQSCLPPGQMADIVLENSSSLAYKTFQNFPEVAFSAFSLTTPSMNPSYPPTTSGQDIPSSSPSQLTLLCECFPLSDSNLTCQARTSPLPSISSCISVPSLNTLRPHWSPCCPTNTQALSHLPALGSLRGQLLIL